MRRTKVWLFSTCLMAALAGTAMLLGTSSSLCSLGGGRSGERSGERSGGATGDTTTADGATGTQATGVGITPTARTGTTTTATPGSPTASIGSSAAKASRGARIKPLVKGPISSRLGTTSTARAEVWGQGPRQPAAPRPPPPAPGRSTPPATRRPPRTPQEPATAPEGLQAFPTPDGPPRATPRPLPRALRTPDPNRPRGPARAGRRRPGRGPPGPAADRRDRPGRRRPLATGAGAWGDPSPSGGSRPLGHPPEAEQAEDAGAQEHQARRLGDGSDVDDAGAPGPGCRQTRRWWPRSRRTRPVQTGSSPGRRRRRRRRPRTQQHCPLGRKIRQGPRYLLSRTGGP